MAKVSAKRIKGGTFFKLLLTGSVVTHGVMTVLVMIAVATGLFEPTQAGDSLSLVQSELYLVLYLIGGSVILIPIWAGIFWLGLYPGIWVYSKFRSTEIHYHET